MQTAQAGVGWGGAGIRPRDSGNHAVAIKPSRRGPQAGSVPGTGPQGRRPETWSPLRARCASGLQSRFGAPRNRGFDPAGIRGPSEDRGTEG